MDDSATRFLDAFNAVEKHLRRLLHADHHVTFGELVEKASPKDAAVRRLRAVLKELSDLRNLVVHTYSRTTPLALPRPHAAERTEPIHHELLSPPRLIQLFRRKVEICGPNALVGQAARRMLEGCFSQLPVYRDSRLVGLLTTD